MNVFIQRVAETDILRFRIDCSTAILIIIYARYHDFNGLPVENWYEKPLKTDNGRQLLWEWQYTNKLVNVIIQSEISPDWYTQNQN